MKQLLAGLLAGLVLAWVFKPEPVPVYRDVIVSDTVILEREPDTVRTFVDRIVTVHAEPLQVATAPSVLVNEVARFCAPVTALITDTVIVEKQVLLRSLSHSPGWFLQPDKLLLTGVTNYGDLKAFDYSVRPGFTARTVGEDVLVQYPRTAWLRQTLEILAPAGLVYLFMR